MEKTAVPSKPSLIARIASFRYVASVMLIFVLALGSLYTTGPNIFSTIFFAQENLQAVDVAKILDVEGYYKIIGADKRKVVSDTIRDGDVIDIDQGSSLLLEIASHNAKIL